MKLLFLSRAYPPITGGLETHNYELHTQLKNKTSTDSIINKKGKKALVFYIPYCCLKSIIQAPKYDAIILGDGVLSCVGWSIKLIRPTTPIICIIHGLDITFSNRIYQYFWVKKFLPKCDRIIAVSTATAHAATEHGINKSKLEVISNGVSLQTNPCLKDTFQLEQILPILCKQKKILLTVGRLVKRKGVNWFIEHVMPFLSEEFLYIVIGDGPEKETINKTIIKKQLSNRVFCLGFVDDDIKNNVFSSADLFIQPNIKVMGDMEGFGISVLEANQYGLAVIGSELEGLKDSITENKNGWLIEPENAPHFIQKINTVCQSHTALKQAGEKARQHCLNNYCWMQIADQYLNSIRNLITPTK